jgi:hypothetical protein
MGDRANACPLMKNESDIPISRQLRLAGMETRPHANRRIGQRRLRA